MSKIKKIAKISIILGFIGCLCAVLGVAGLYLYLEPKLPEIDVLQDIQLQEPLRVYTRDGLLISEYGDKRRIPLDIQQIPKQLQHAFISSEDDRFYSHPGVDWQGLVRAALVWLTTGSKKQGGSTITMQVARNFFLTREKSILRKINEIFLSLKISNELSKDKVLELYLNKIYLGKRAYGVAAAAQVYYGKTVDELSLAEIAMIAGLPKAPSRFNPIAWPERALTRRNYVLGRMLELDYIAKEAYETAKAEPITAKVHAIEPEVEAHYIGEMVRAEIAQRYPGDAYSSGLKVFTTLDGQQQLAANAAVRKGLTRIDQRHGYRGVIANAGDIKWNEDALDQKAADEIMKPYSRKAGLRPALVTRIKAKQAQLYFGEGEQGVLHFDNMQWARKHYRIDSIGPKLNKISDALKTGDIIYVELNDKGHLTLAQLPEIESALVALRPSDGAVTALVGGYNFFKSKFNRATQAMRQAGSSFKPFMYTAALDNGYTPASIINDAPVVFDDPSLESKWKPENYSGKFYGPTRLRIALANSRNLVSIRLLIEQQILPVRSYVTRFGFKKNRLPTNLSLALGTGSVTPMELVGSYAILANQGYRVTPYFIDRIENANEEILYQSPRKVACLHCVKKRIANADKPEETHDVDAVNAEEISEEASVELELPATESAPTHTQAKRVISPRTAYLIRSMLQDVVKQGTARRALRLGRNDLAGKTGTTNDQVDAWFSGFNDDIVATVWVGHDTLESMGRGDTGASAALPIWVDFMEIALKDSPKQPRSLPNGLVSVRIDPASGLLAHPDQSNAIFELFPVESVPTEMAIPDPSVITGANGEVGAEDEELF